VAASSELSILPGSIPELEHDVGSLCGHYRVALNNGAVPIRSTNVKREPGTAADRGSRSGPGPGLQYGMGRVLAVGQGGGYGGGARPGHSSETAAPREAALWHGPGQGAWGHEVWSSGAAGSRGWG